MALSPPVLPSGIPFTVYTVSVGCFLIEIGLVVLRKPGNSDRRNIT